ncbi:MAG: hypothetical protein HKP02_05365 [Xanthomonadales bacterium]|nr:hypothetical protein [Xanthomonadales bacterium]
MEIGDQNRFPCWRTSTGLLSDASSFFGFPEDEGGFFFGSGSGTAGAASVAAGAAGGFAAGDSAAGDCGALCGERATSASNLPTVQCDSMLWRRDRRLLIW